MNFIFKELCKEIMTSGLNRNTRGTSSKEVLAKKVILFDPRSRLIAFENRTTDLNYAIGEFLYYMSGSNSIEHIAHYAPSIIKYSDDGVSFNSAYGFNIFNRFGNQWEAIKNILIKDPDSRRAVILLRSPEDLFKMDTNDSICSLSMHFIINSEKLDLIVNMRSNDLIVGFPNDIFCFTMLQEMMACELNLELGIYYHIANSLHIYDKHFRKAKAVIKEKSSCINPMQKMTFEQDISIECQEILYYEKIIRNSSYDIISVSEQLMNDYKISEYWKRLLLILCFKPMKKLNQKEKYQEIIDYCGEVAKYV